MTQRLKRPLTDYPNYHEVIGATGDTLKHKRKELGLFIRWLEDRGHTPIA